MGSGGRRSVAPAASPAARVRFSLGEKEGNERRTETGRGVFIDGERGTRGTRNGSHARVMWHARGSFLLGFGEVRLR